MRDVRKLVPWWARIGLKLTLSRIPVSYAFWKSLNVFRHGEMDDPEYSLRVFADHWQRSLPHFDRQPAAALELGPGDSLASALIAHAHDVAKLILVDAGPYATRDMGVYRRVAAALIKRGMPVPPSEALSDANSMMLACGASYLTAGANSLEELPADSVDWIWSQAVLEHVRLAEIDRSLVAMRRIMRRGGVASHRIDLQDHLGGSLNNLRFADRFWERDGFAYRGGFYTNRVRAGEWVRRFIDAGFWVESLTEERWPVLPVPRKQLAPRFKGLSEEDLRVRGLSLVLRAA